MVAVLGVTVRREGDSVTPAPAAPAPEDTASFAAAGAPRDINGGDDDDAFALNWTGGGVDDDEEIIYLVSKRSDVVVIVVAGVIVLQVLCEPVKPLCLLCVMR